ncbi:tyrosine-protein kinase Fes/Fps-like [Daphnia magna]|uniref:tyrosine-protein kinase Fes/Fps-like n=1 Tax=Daphnia magna TaxID=35525 RepID=UPI001E1BD369|nr:tyrosine-protein kinase Fes/Fps-like [Daphnia magna]
MSLRFDTNTVLGSGGFGIVFLGAFEGRQVAVKRIELRKSNEEEVLLELDHPNIVKLFHVQTDANFKYYVFELCDASLRDLFLKSDDKIKYNGPIPRLIEVFLQLASGLEHIHSKRIVHRNIHPSNILIATRRTDQNVEVTIKMAGFHLSKRVDEWGSYELEINEIKGNRNWIAPELLKLLNTNIGNADYNVKNDIFALALVFGYLLLGGEHLYGSEEKGISNMIMESGPINMLKIDGKLLHFYQKLLLKMLEYNPGKRISATRVVQELKSIKDELTANDSNALHYLIPVKNATKMEIKIKVHAKLGKGGFAEVFKGEFRGNNVAVKIVEINKVNVREEETMKELDHPNIIKLLHCENDEREEYRYYALDLCNASLDKLFLKSEDPQKYRGPLPRHIDIFLQLASGLEHIHKKKITHRDINPKNILISTPNQHGEVTIKWADFGLSRTVNERGTYTVSQINGTINWFAPETLKILMEGSESRGDTQSDVFALALVFGYLLLDGKHLYGSNQVQIDSNIMNKNPINMREIDGKVREFYKDNLLLKMLEDEPKKRMSSSQVVEELTSIKEKLPK